MFPLCDPSAKGSKSVSGEGRAVTGSSQSGGDFFQRKMQHWHLPAWNREREDGMRLSLA